MRREERTLEVVFPVPTRCRSSAYEYRATSGVKQALVALVGSCANLKVFSGEKTFEYDLALENPANTVLVTDALIHSEAIKGLCAMPDTLPDTLAKQFESEELESLDAIQDVTQKDRHRFAATYLRCAENAKGEHAICPCGTHSLPT